MSYVVSLSLINNDNYYNKDQDNNDNTDDEYMKSPAYERVAFLHFFHVSCLELGMQFPIETML